MGRGRQGSGVEVNNGTLRIRFTYQGKRYAETLFGLKPTAANIKAATRIAAEIRQKIALGVFDYAATFPNSKNLETAAPKDITLADYQQTYLDTLAGAKSSVKLSTNDIKNFWVPKLGHKALKDIKHSDIATLIAEKKKAGVTGKRINNMLIPIRDLFEAAEADGHIDRSPLSKIKNLSHQKPDIDPFEREEMLAILAHQAAHYPEVVWNYYQGAFGTGVRPSEQIALQWPDLDWNKRQLKVSRAIVLGDEKATKTSRIRYIDLTDFAMEAFTRQKKHTFMRNHGFIFCTPEGEPWPNEKRQRVRFFQPALKACGIRGRDAYNTRHTFATTALMAGINPSYIASQLGHTTTAMLFQRYAKWIPGADDGRAAAQLNGAFGRTGLKLASSNE